MSSPIPFARNPFCFYPEVPRISPKGYLPNGLKVPRCRVSQLLSAREAAGKPYLLPADRHDEPEMVRYLELEKAFEADFGFPFSSEDGWDPHFKRMTFHALVAENLCHRFNNDASKIAAEFSKPLIFNVQNPYLDGDARQLNLEMELRRSKLMYEGADAVDSLPLAINTQFPFRLRLPCTACWGPAGYYDATWQPQVQDIYINQEVFSSAARQFDASSTQLSPPQPLIPPTSPPKSVRGGVLRNRDKHTERVWPPSPTGSDGLVALLVVELAVLHILRLSHLEVHPIPLIYGNVRGIFEYFPIGPPIQVSLSGFDGRARGEATTMEGGQNFLSSLVRQAGHERVHGRGHLVSEKYSPGVNEKKRGDRAVKVKDNNGRGPGVRSLNENELGSRSQRASVPKTLRRSLKGSHLVQLWHDDRTKTLMIMGLESHQRRWERITNLECCWESFLGTKFEGKLTSCQSLTLERRKMRVQLSRAKRRLSGVIGARLIREKWNRSTIRRVAVKKGLNSSPLAVRDMSFSATSYSTQIHSARYGETTPRFIIHAHHQTCRLSPCFFGNSKQTVENAWLMVSSISERKAILTSDREPVETVWAQLGPLAPATRTYITGRNEERIEGHSGDVLDDYRDWALGNSLRNKCRALVKYVPLE
ncbi:hypothetical protein DFH06DRAFT_1152699 [Mycena polygramma]|nr:hypothetical protein DFH06DRAFT_1152699 [Mycena polygramma]